jgi:hypothetical protein
MMGLGVTTIVFDCHATVEPTEVKIAFLSACGEKYAKNGVPNGGNSR